MPLGNSQSKPWTIFGLQQNWRQPFICDNLQNTEAEQASVTQDYWIRPCNDHRTKWLMVNPMQLN